MCKVSFGPHKGQWGSVDEINHLTQVTQLISVRTETGLPSASYEPTVSWSLKHENKQVLLIFFSLAPKWFSDVNDHQIIWDAGLKHRPLEPDRDLGSVAEEEPENLFF